MRYRIGCRLHLSLSLSLSLSALAGLTTEAHAGECDDNGIRYVRPGGSPTNSGFCWEEAFDKLEDALDDLNEANSGVIEIHIAQGTYKPPSGSQSFLISKACVIRGGYEGDPDNPASWNPQTFVTTLSGDLNGNDDGTQKYLLDNARHVLEATAFLDAGELHIEGLTIERGCAGFNSTNVKFGGGLLVHGQFVEVEVFVEDCIFRDNRASAGGGAIASWSGTFAQISAEEENPSATTGAPVRVRRCRFQSNILHSAIDDDGPATLYHEFGGCAVFSDADLRIVQCDFVGNRNEDEASPHGGAVFAWRPATLLRVVNSSFVENEVQANGLPIPVAGAVLAWGTEEEPGMAVNITGCLFAGNRAVGNAGEGGAIAMSSSNGQLMIDDSTIVGNDAADLGGGVLTHADATITNSILYRNTSIGSTAEQQLWYIVSDGPEVTIRHSCVEGLALEENDTNINSEPAFVDEQGGNYRLKCSSPARDVGNHNLVPLDDEDVDGDSYVDETLPLDLDARTRLDGSQVDMGAYEHALACKGDLNGDHEVDGDDLGTLLGEWGVCPDCLSNFNCDAEVDGDDLGTLLGAWGCCPGFDCDPDPMPENFTGDPVSPQALAEEFGFETVEELAEWLASLDFQTMSALLEGLFGS
ncbi:MAG: hypothetical protein FJ253_00620 [Phycisphaerae bacterium]|nr:hypothetical protein [Phycisphaerae bacterium]